MILKYLIDTPFQKGGVFLPEILFHQPETGIALGIQINNQNTFVVWGLRKAGGQIDDVGRLANPSFEVDECNNLGTHILLTGLDPARQECQPKLEQFPG